LYGTKKLFFLVLRKFLVKNLIKGDFMFFSTSLMLAGHFGFNTNILETNVLNLAVVLAIVITYVGDALRGLLANRKQTILNNFREADQRASEAQERLTKARIQLEQAQAKAKQIHEQALVTIEEEKKQFVRQTQEDIKRLAILQQETLKFEQQKAQNELAQKLVKLALHQVREKLTQRLNSSIHSAVNNFQIVLFTNYKPN
jgi:F-type H+-transporting ATPase subunit b